MKTFLKYIFLIVPILSILLSCIKDEGVFVSNEINKGSIQVIGSVMDFDNKSVGTKALGAEDENESLITEMTMFVFDQNGNSITPSPVTIHNYNTNPDAFMIDIEAGFIATLNTATTPYYFKKTNSETGVTTPEVAGVTLETLKKCSIYVVANAAHYLKTDSNGDQVSVYSDIKTLSQLEDQILPVQGFEMPRYNGRRVGFPMIGTTEDGTTFNLIDANANQNTIAQIPLRKLYSKVVVNFMIHADQVVQTPRFDLVKWSVKNSPKQVKFGTTKSGYVKSYEDSGETNSSTYQSIEHTESTDTWEGSHVMSFTFYMPEHLVIPSGVGSYTYPTSITDTEKQRFKPDLLKEGGETATYVQVEGAYTDHNGVVSQVLYKLYLGQNNYDDFKVIRNQQLNNFVTIKGLTNSTNAIVPGQPANISVDHRVSISNTGISIAMERESLMDAHFEFRPVDINLSAGSSLTVTIPESDRSWIAIEKSQPSGDYHVLNVGIRKYFTEGLVSDLTTMADNDAAGPVLKYQNNTDTSQKYRFWIYVDENPNVYDNAKHGYYEGEEETATENNYAVYTDKEYREGKIIFEYTDASGTKVINSNIRQRHLWRLWNGDWTDSDVKNQPTRFYDIEYHEEYLHNYAADDPYGKTTDGMAWGLNGITFSGNMGDELKTQALMTHASGLTSSWIDDIIANVSPYYDFYLPEEALDISEEIKVPNNGFAGRRFSNGIIDSDPDEEGDYNPISQILRELNDTPDSAVEYCLNKNLRSSETDTYGKVLSRNWYLPAIDEIQEIVVAGYSDFNVFQDKMYWSCQPAFHRNHFLYTAALSILTSSDAKGDYYMENPESARATSAKYDGVDEYGKDKYTYTRSGANNDGYYQSLEVSAANQNAKPILIGVNGRTIKYWDGTKEGPWYNQSKVYQDILLNQINYEAGYHSRTTNINRVRCVYRSGNTK